MRFMPIKTLHITNSYHPASGGIRTFYNALLEAASRHRRLVRLVVPGAQTSVQEVGEFGRVYQIAAPRAPVLDSRYRWLLPHTYALPYQSTLRKILAAERPDLVEVCDKFWLLYLSGVLRRGWIADLPVPVIVGLTCERLDDNMATYVSASGAARYVCERYMHSCYAPRFDFHIAASDYIAAEVRRALPERLNGRLFVCPMGVDFDTFGQPCDSGEMRQGLFKQLNGNESTILLLYAGRLSKEKNLGVLPPLLDVLAGHTRRDYRLVIAGEGPAGAELRSSLERAAPGRSLFLGQCNRETLRVLYHAADVFIHPNPREPFGIAPLEAMAAGLPLVAPESGGLLTYANRKNAWLAENTPGSLARAVERVHDDPAARLAKTEKARQTAQEFSWARITGNYFVLYDELHRRNVQERASKENLAQVQTYNARSSRISLFP
jgi:glycosyltransferase involved in cell wall biosynthesis